MGLIATKWFHDRLICLRILPHFVNVSLHFVTLSRNLIPSCANLNFRQLQRFCLRSCLTEWIKYFTCLFSPIVPDQFYFWVQLYWTYWTDLFSGNAMINSENKIDNNNNNNPQGILSNPFWMLLMGEITYKNTKC